MKEILSFLTGIILIPSSLYILHVLAIFIGKYLCKKYKGFSDAFDDLIDEYSLRIERIFFSLIFYIGIALIICIIMLFYQLGNLILNSLNLF